MRHGKGGEEGWMAEAICSERLLAQPPRPSSVGTYSAWPCPLASQAL